MPTLIEKLEPHHADNFGWALACCDWHRAQASDVLQEAYLRVIDGRARFSGRASERTWFFGVIRRVALESQRRERRWWWPDIDRLPEEAGPDLTSEAAVTDAQARRLRGALLALSRRQREVLHLVFYGGLTLEEAASTLAISIGSARTHYHRGKDRLATLLEDDGT